MNRSEQAPAPFSLTEGLVRALRRPVDASARRRAAWHWLDWIGCVAAGSRAPVARALAGWQPVPAAETDPTGAPAERRWPALAGMAASDMQAVWLDAGLANVEEMDDMHREGILHPGPVVLPVVAHFARHAGLGADAALDAVVRGYETTIRVGRSAGAAHYAQWHTTATAGVFGAAAAAADALGLTDEQATWALGNAGTQAAGLWQVRLEPVMSKQLHTGHAAWAGLVAALLARSGFTGPRFILEGEKGFFRAMCDGAMPERVLAPADDWLIHETSFKPWPSCRHTHPTVDCVLAIREALGDRPLDLADAVVDGFADAVKICDTPVPQTRTEAKFSLQYCVAATARWGRLLPGHFDEIAFADPASRAAAARVRLRTCADLTRAYPARFGGRVKLTLADGSVHTASVADALGDPERPLDEQGLLDKAQALMRYGGVSESTSRAVCDAASALAARSGADASRTLPRVLLEPLF